MRQHADRYKAIGRPKSKSSTSTVPLPPDVINALREWKAACPPGEEGLVCTYHAEAALATVMKRFMLASQRCNLAQVSLCVV